MFAAIAAFFLPDDLFGLEYWAVHAAARVPDFAVWPFEFLDAGKTCSDSADHVAVHGDPTLRAGAERTVGNSLEKSVGTTGEKLEELAGFPELDELIVQRLSHKSLCTL